MNASPQSLKQQIGADMKDAMRARDKARLSTIRLIMAAVKQREIDERTELDDIQVVAVLNRMVKQRHDAIAQYEAANRLDLAGKEHGELAVIQTYLPAALAADEVTALIEQTIAQTGAGSMKEMGAVMAALSKELQGRADMGQVSALVKERLSQ